MAQLSAFDASLFARYSGQRRHQRRFAACLFARFLILASKGGIRCPHCPRSI